MISAGGTGGGIYPALAVVEALENSMDVLWVGGIGGMEAGLVSRAGLNFEAIPAAGLHGVGLANMPANMVQLMKGTVAARRIIRSYQPDVLFFTGGYVGIPAAVAGKSIPSLAYVPDIEPGLALKWICRMADRIAVTTTDSHVYFDRPHRLVTTGYPVRKGLKISRTEARKIMGLEDDRPVLLVFGGSRGARSLNQSVWRDLARLLEHAQVVHITGQLDWPTVSDVLSSLKDGGKGYYPFQYLHNEMSAALSAADLVVSRAGASILGEFTALGLPSILAPYPHAWRYQKTNADYLVSHGAAVQIEDESLEDKFANTVLGLLADRKQLQVMSAAAQQLARPEASAAIAAELHRLAGKGGSHG